MPVIGSGSLIMEASNIFFVVPSGSLMTALESPRPASDCVVLSTLSILSLSLPKEGTRYVVTVPSSAVWSMDTVSLELVTISLSLAITSREFFSSRMNCAIKDDMLFCVPAI
jgi:hypothetical protein